MGSSNLSPGTQSEARENLGLNAKLSHPASPDWRSHGFRTLCHFSKSVSSSAKSECGHVAEF